MQKPMRIYVRKFVSILVPLILTGVLAGVPAFGEKINGTVGFEGQEFRFTFRAGRAASDAPSLPDPKDPAIDASIPSPRPVSTAVTNVPPKPAASDLVGGISPEISKDGFLIPEEWGLGSAVNDLRQDSRIVFRDITFDLNSSTIKPESYPTLQRLLFLIQSNAESRFLIEGHTDSTGDASVNQQLSVERAEAVKTWLVNNGIAGDRLETVGFGASQPTASNDTEEGRLQNRRVEVVRK
ncbi:MAG TPA: OmpA family protein [Candidatus Ozemobacteraceae bacterium]|nr:OmpA family protein [Candidatus Ozemobacteraceae bacterium]